MSRDICSKDIDRQPPRRWIEVDNIYTSYNNSWVKIFFFEKTSSTQTKNLLLA